MYRKILHCDMNNFFASVELLDRSDLRGKLVAVCGNQAERHGIILAKSPEAKLMGVKTGEIIASAQAKCHGQLYLLKANYDKYIKYSKLAKQIYFSYTDQVESYGLDECWLDLTHSQNLFGTPQQIARKIMLRVKAELGLTISVGYSYNKVFAKLASDIASDQSLMCIEPKHFRQQIWNLPIANLLGVGRQTNKLLRKYKILTIGDYARTEPKFLEHLLGINGVKLWYYANGRDISPVRSYAQPVPIKSIGNGTTCVRDIVNISELEAVLLRLAELVQERLQKHAYLARVLQLHVRYQDFQQQQFQMPLAYPAFSSRYFVDNLLTLIKKNNVLFAPIRAVSLRASNLMHAGQAEQLAWTGEYAIYKRHSKLDMILQEIRDNYGANAVAYAVQYRYNSLLPQMRTTIMPNSLVE